jgi:hypothetical protein
MGKNEPRSLYSYCATNFILSSGSKNTLRYLKGSNEHQKRLIRDLVFFLVLLLFWRPDIIALPTGIELSKVVFVLEMKNDICQEEASEPLCASSASKRGHRVCDVSLTSR